MRKSLALSIMVALIALPALTACKSSRTSNRRRASKAPSGRLVATTPTPPPAPDLTPPSYVDPGPYGSAGTAVADGGFAPEGFSAPGGTYYDEGGFSGAPSEGFAQGEYGVPMPTATNGALQTELEAARAEAERLSQERDSLMASLDSAKRNAIEAEEALVGAPPAGMGGGASPLASGGEQVPVEDALRSLEADLRRGGSGAEVLREGSSVIVRLTDVFAPGKDSLRGDARASQALSATAQALARYPGARVAVVGHSDSTPIVKTKHLWRSNQHLSEARAQTVARMLGQVGQVSVEGRGASQPLIPNERTKQDRARNRRVDIVISL